MTGVLVLFTRCEQKKRERERGGGRGEKTIRLKNLLQTPEEPCDWGFRSSSRGAWCISAALREHIPSWPDIERNEYTHTAQNCHSTAPASNTKATSSHCVRPSPFIQFSTACTTTKAEKLGSCVDDRATNLFGGTHYISSLYSSAAERGELNMDMQRWASLWRWGHQQCPAITSGIINTFHMGQMPRPDYQLCIWFNTFSWYKVTSELIISKMFVLCYNHILFSRSKLSCNLHISLSKGPHQIIKSHMTLHLNKNIVLCSRLRLLAPKGEVIT